MRRTLSKFICLALWAASGAGAMTVAQLQDQLAAGAKLTIIDIRSPALYAKSHVPGAINVPESVCPQKALPPVGRTLVYDSGLDRGDAAAQKAAVELSANSGVKTEVLDGGYAGWESSHGLTTRGKGAKRESFNYITYAQLKAARAGDVVIVDLRRPRADKPLSDLAQEFPGTTQVKSTAEKAAHAVSGGAAPMIVIIDNVDGTAEQSARILKADGSRRYAILAGGEAIVARKGQRGLQRDGAGSGVRPNQNFLSTGSAK
ncbi:MAG TPA: rhodanese-like domain-containing protein [Candidatus Saccharimonadales bacterium]|nr:rhodanese-like domain-containing protein [Candidatus Saccharimonadales bacterium]